MPKIKTADLTDLALDWAVAKCAKITIEKLGNDLRLRELMAGDHPVWHPSDNWSQGGPIIEREGISLRREPTGGWYAFKNFSLCTELPFTHCAAFDAGGDTALEAAMRCYVASKMGEEVNVPDELLPKGKPTCPK